jgi:hypothetical protein
MFRVHRYFFERESKYFKEQLAVPATPGAQRRGTGDDSAIILDHVRSEDFAKLLWVFYNPYVVEFSLFLSFCCCCCCPSPPPSPSRPTHAHAAN